MADLMSDMSALLETPLTSLHDKLGAKTTAFAGYKMPLQYSGGVMSEHLWTRKSVGLFDVSHMGQISIEHDAGIEAAAAALESIMPIDVLGIAPMRQRYGFLTNEAGGLLDDLMIMRHENKFILVVNAACKDTDFSYMTEALRGCEVTMLSERALLAVQGPKSETALAPIIPAIREMRFQDVCISTGPFGVIWITRSGYTGEDGFEISVEEDAAEALAHALLGQDVVAPIGLAARDTLRLEAGLCLYGQDIDEKISPVAAGLGWAIGPARRAIGARAGGFPGSDQIFADLEKGTKRQRIGLRPDGRAPMRQGTALFAEKEAEHPVGIVTSGAFGPSIGGSISMGYVPSNLAKPGLQMWGEVRGKRLPLHVTALPFVPAKFKRKKMTEPT